MRDDHDPRYGDGTRPSPRCPEPDAHGQAALLLVESILHVLIEARALTLDQAIDAVRTASEVKVEVATETGESNGRMRASLALLSGIAQTLDVDGRFAKSAPQPSSL